MQEVLEECSGCGSHILRRWGNMTGLEESLIVGVALSWLSIGVMKIVIKNLIEEWEQWVQTEMIFH